MAIILKANNLFNKEELHDLHEMYMKQLNDGLIILQGGIQFVHESTEAHEIEIIQEEQTPAADPQRELHITRMRLQHLLQSEFIRSFDEKDIRTGDYVRDIREADNEVATFLDSGIRGIRAVPIEEITKLRSLCRRMRL